MARGIPLVILGASGKYSLERARTIAWGSKGPRLCGIGGIGINGVETNRWIMTDVAYVVVIIRLIVSIHLSPVGDGLMETNYDIIT